MPPSLRVCPPHWETLSHSANSAFPPAPESYVKCRDTCQNDPTCNAIAFTVKMCLTSTDCVPVDCVNCLNMVMWTTPVNAIYAYSSRNGEGDTYIIITSQNT